MTAQELKSSILQLAIQGKLVKQNPKDEPASVLLEKIKKEKEALIKEKKIKKEKYSTIYKDTKDNHYYEEFENGSVKDITEEIPFEIPQSWYWVRFDDICNIINGFTPLKSNPDFWNSKDIPWFTINDIRNQGRFINYTDQYISKKAVSSKSNRIVPANTVLLCCTASVGEYAYTKIDLTTNQQFNALVIKEHFKNYIDSMYLYEFVQTLKAQIKINAGKTTFAFLSVDKLKKFLIPIPPIHEQFKIVEKIERISIILETYDKIFLKLKDLNDSYKENLKKSILQYTIEGKLVMQDWEDEPAYKLVEKIQDEKKELIKNKKLKKEEFSIIYKDNANHQFYEKFENGTIINITEEIPFEIPDNWCWTRLGTILKKLSDGTHKTPKYINSGIPFLSVKDMSSGKICFDNTKFISKEEHDLLYKRCNPEKGDILLSKIGTTGIPVIVDSDKEFSLFVSIALLKFNANFINTKYLKYILMSPFVQRQCRENTKGVGNKNWVIKDIAKTLIAFPPLNEQDRIAKKIDTIFSTIS